MWSSIMKSTTSKFSSTLNNAWENEKRLDDYDDEDGGEGNGGWEDDEVVGVEDGDEGFHESDRFEQNQQTQTPPQDTSTLTPLDQEPSLGLLGGLTRMLTDAARPDNISEHDKDLGENENQDGWNDESPSFSAELDNFDDENAWEDDEQNLGLTNVDLNQVETSDINHEFSFENENFSSPLDGEQNSSLETNSSLPPTSKEGLHEEQLSVSESFHDVQGHLEETFYVSALNETEETEATNVQTSNVNSGTEDSGPVSSYQDLVETHTDFTAHESPGQPRNFSADDHLMSPLPGGTPVAVVAARESMQTMLNEISEQEQQMSDSMREDSRDYLSEDEVNHDQAVSQIQHELGITLTPRTRHDSNVFKPLIDVTPPVSSLHYLPPQCDISLDAVAAPEDHAFDSGRSNKTGDEDQILGCEDEIDYGLVVDQTPRRIKENRHLLRDDSLAVLLPVAVTTENLGNVGMGWEEDFDEAIEDDDDADDTLGSTLGSTGVSAILEAQLLEPGVVDHTPTDASILAAHKDAVPDVSVAVLASEGDSSHIEPDDDANINDFGPVVDHTPKPDDMSQSATIRSVTNSLAVNAPALDEDFRVDDAMDETTYFCESTIDGNTLDAAGWEDEDPDLDDDEGAGDNLQKIIKGKDTDANIVLLRCPRIKFSDQNVVDHTPSEMAPFSTGSVLTKDPSLAVLVTEDDISDSANNDIDDEVYGNENEIEFGPVVDHTPSTPAHPQQAISTVNSLEVNAFDLEEDDAMDDYGDSTIGDNTWNRDDPTVDDDDAPKSTLRLDVGKITALNGDGVAMVDHTPSDMGDILNKQDDPSVDVLPSAASSSKVDVDHDSQGDDLVYGPVVDQTPPTPVQSLATMRSDSIVVQAYDLDTVDETFAFDDDTFAHSEGAHRPVDEEDQVVDHIPARPESRFCDASTLVAADPSEYMSEVDDMAQEENFGPVVDLTPPTLRPLTLLPTSAAGSTAAGSTAVFAPPSVVADDLDPDADEDAGGEQNGWNESPVDEQAPNPQSGNDEPVAEHVNEQLVDFLPPQNDIPMRLRPEEASELTVGGAQSLLQPLDPKEDDFGPVVDQTPTILSSIAASGLSQASTATQLSTTECMALNKDDDAEGASDVVEAGKKVVVDNMPSQMQHKRQIDSTYSICESQLAEDEEDDSKFGPVVDHLPTSRASHTPSRGGSTVDALATVSEVNSVDDGGDAWDDDADIDVSESGVSDGTALQTAAATRLAIRKAALAAGITENEKNFSVRFEENVATSPPYFHLEQVQYNDPESCEDEIGCHYQSANDTWIEGIEMRNALYLATDHQQPDASFADADTPPSTPYRRPEAGLALQEPLMLEEPLMLDNVCSSAITCANCNTAKTSECPCVRRLLANADQDSLVGTLLTPEGESVKIDFRKLTQDEITKRILVSKEASALRLKLESSALEGSELASKVQSLEVELMTVQSSNADLEQTNMALQEEHDNFCKEKLRLEDELQTMRKNLKEADEKLIGLVSQEAALKVEVLQLNEALNKFAEQQASEMYHDSKLENLQKEVTAKSEECETLSKQLISLEERLNDTDKSRCTDLQELQTLRMKLELIEQDDDVGEQQFLEQTIQDLNAKCFALQKSKHEAEKALSELQLQYESELKRQYELNDRRTENLSAMTAAFDSEKQKLIREISKQRLIVANSESLAKELLSVAKERDLLHESLNESKEAISLLQKHVDDYGQDMATYENCKQNEITKFRSELTDVKIALAEKNSEIDLLTKNIEDLLEKKEWYHKELDMSQAKCHSLEATCEQFKAQLGQERVLVSEAQSEVELHRSQVSRIKEDLEQSDTERRKSLSHLAALGRKLEKIEVLSKANEEKAHSYELKLEEKELELRSSEDKNSALVMEVANLDIKCKELNINVENLQKDFEKQLQELKDVFDANTANMKAENSLLASDLSEKRKECELLIHERNQLLVKCEDIEHYYTVALRDSQEKIEELQRNNDNNSLEYQTAERVLRDELIRMKTQVECFLTERDNLSTACKKIELDCEQRVKEAEEKTTQLVEHYQINSELLTNKVNELEKRREQLEDDNKEFQNIKLRLQEVLNERDALYEENEEMLVQFGLLKEQMDVSEEHVQCLQAELLEYKFATEDTTLSTEQTSEFSISLKTDVEQLTAANTFLELQVRSLKDDKANLEHQMIELKSYCNNFAGQAEELESLRSAFASMQARCDELGLLCSERESLIQKLSDKTENNVNELNSLTNLQRTIEQFEAVCKSKDIELETTQERLKASNDTVTLLQLQLNSLNKVSNDRDEQICLLRENCNDLQKHLNLANDQLAAAEATLKTEESLVAFGSLEAKKSNVIADYDKRLKDLESELFAKNQLITSFEAKLNEFQLQSDNDGKQNASHVDVLDGDNEEVARLKNQVEILSGALKSTRSRLESKEDDVDRLNEEVTRLQFQASRPTADSNFLEMPADNDEDVDDLRAGIISLAMALERSENMRAEAYSRLLKERETNAESLRRLSESVKRFYTQVSHASP